ncbi:MAG: GLPGLI family protein [Flavobacteriaceae bacterium]|jgi:GLPGLI family protein|nr:GLPGLI family protein [Flavobacteriaceae bacterium]
MKQNTNSKKQKASRSRLKTRPFAALAFLFLILGTLANAQNQRFFYEYKYIPDSTNRSDVKTEMMILDVNKNGSKYYSHEKFVSDSITKAEVEKQLQSGLSGFGNINIQKRDKPGSVDYSVTKTYPDYEVFLHKNIQSDNYKIAEDQKPEWKLFPEKQQIGTYNTQKATANFGGREWTAWFCNDIPIPDGPYKFHGLPGLIVKVEDKTGSFEMTLVGNKKNYSTSDTDIKLPGNMIAFGLGGNEIEVSKKQFRKVWQDYINDPAKNMRQMMMKMGDGTKTVIKMKTEDGKEITDMSEIYRGVEQRTKEMLEKNNNEIEPELFH